MTDSFVLDHIKPAPILANNPASIWNRNETLECGRFYQIISPSGSGKSTLIGILNGIRNDFKGNLSYNGVSLAGYSLDEWIGLRNKNISTVYQDLKLFDELTVLENISILDSFADRKKEENPINEWLLKLNIQDKINEKVKFLSYGQKQRVAIIRALNREFRWLMLDEPFSHLDVANIEIANNLIIEQCKRQKAGLLITGLDKRFVQNDFLPIII
jgi:putative ABC transport system ATP-binding protein